MPGWHTIRGRVFIVLAVPTCLLLAAGGLAVSDRAAAYGDAQRAQSAVSLSMRVQGLVHQLQRERGLTNGLLGGATGFRAPLQAQRAQVDTRLSALRKDELGAAENRALGRLDRLPAVRTSVDNGTAARAATFQFFTAAISALNEADPASDTVTRGDQRLRQGLDALQALADATESVALERGTFNGVLAEGRFQGTEYLDFTEIRAQRMAAIARFDRFATPTQRAALNRAFATPAARRAAGIEQIAQSGADGSPLHASTTVWWDSMTTLVDDLYGVQQRVGADLRARAQQLSDSAAGALGGYLALAVVVTALVAAAAWVAVRSITRPLDALAREADNIAGERLPDTVRRIQEAKPGDGTTLSRLLRPQTPSSASKNTAREIAAMAAALQGVEETALRLASEQAMLRRNSTESLACLGRRSQGLIRRQLGLITALERQEIDPDALAELFKLDHLATRMRRNAESLLILAGEHTPRPVTGTASGHDLVRSAISEVEQYQRVVIADVEPCRVQGHAVAELAHLLAELTENALTFSPPNEPVEVYGWSDGAEYCVAVIDHGVGMSQADMERSNARLSGKDALALAPTRFLGHYVVGRLAGRLNVEVRLYDTPGGGVTALVALPSRLLGPKPTESESLSETTVGAVPARAVAHENVSVMLNGFRAGVARAEATKEATS